MLQPHAEQLALPICFHLWSPKQGFFQPVKLKCKTTGAAGGKGSILLFQRYQRSNNHAFKHEFEFGTLCTCLKREESHFPMICRKWRKFQHKHTWFIYHIILRLLSQARKHGCASKLLTDTRRKMRTQLSKWREGISAGIMEFLLKTPL